MRKIIEGDIKLQNLCLRNLPDSLLDVKIMGMFDCSDNELTSLEGAPTDVWSFDCSSNKLINLEHAPKIVAGDFFCVANRLESLKGAPDTVNGCFMCLDNPLISLEGIPKKIGKKLYISRELKNAFPEEYILSLSDISGGVFYW